MAVAADRRRRWWVQVELATDFDLVRDRELIQDLRGYLCEVMIQDAVVTPPALTLLLSIVGTSKAAARRDATILVTASSSVPILRIRVVSAAQWLALRRDAVAAVRLPRLPSPSDYVTWRHDRLTGPGELDQGGTRAEQDAPEPTREGSS